MERPGIDEWIRQAREHEAAQDDGRLPNPAFVAWPTFPFEGELKVRHVADPVVPEPPRRGAGGVDCRACAEPDSAYLWTNELWRVRSSSAPTGLPAVLFLEPRPHYDLDGLSDEHLGQLGVMMRRIEKALLGLGGIERVQIARWGDGSEHFHLWFLPRPRGFTQGRGTFLALWDDILPPRPDAEWRQTLEDVASALRTQDSQSWRDRREGAR